MKFEYTKNLIVKLMKRECDVNYDIARIWIKYLENKKSEEFSETWARVYTSNEIEKILERSVMVHKDHYMKWIEGEFDNDLPIASSGSTITALLDIDNLYVAFDNAIEEIAGDEDRFIYEGITKYHNEKDTIFRKTFLDPSGIGY
tara:strand:+ start:159 stop:593 length:435 start_codon:yes stop_codon:yes gene_type:complete